MSRTVKAGKAKRRGTAKLRVLIGDERSLVVARLTATLQGLGHRVVGVARDGYTALAAAWRLRPDIILLDVRLPPRDGIEAARAILTGHVFPVVLFTGYNSADLTRRAQEAGVLVCQVWPADARALGSAMGAASARFRELRVLRDQAQDPEHVFRTRLVVERAKKLLMRKLWLGETESFDYIRRHSHGMPIGGMAAQILADDEALFGRPALAGCVDIILGALARSEALGPQRVA
jgi:response regulator NasT